MAYRTVPLQTYVRQALDYHPLPGDLWWRIRPVSHFSSPEAAARWNAKYAGTRAGYISSRGYRVLTFGDRHFQSARIIWRLMTNNDPGSLQVDHKDRNKLNDAWSNLRLAGRGPQQQNRTYSTNKYGFRGVVRYKKKFRGEVRANGVRHRSNLVGTPFEAHLEYCYLAQTLHGEFFCHTSPYSYQETTDIDDLYPT